MDMRSNDETNSNRQIKKGAIASYIGVIFTIITGIVYTPWMIAQIGKENYGLYTLSLSIIGLFLFDFGLSDAVTKFSSKIVYSKDKLEMQNLTNLFFRLYSFVMILVFIALFVVYFFIPQIYLELSTEEANLFQSLYIIVATFSVLSLPFIPLNGILKSYEKFSTVKIIDLAQKFVSLALITLALILDYGIYALVMINALVGILSIMVRYYFFTRMTKLKFNISRKNVNVHLKDILKFSGWNGVVSISQRLVFTITPSILGIMSGSISIAIFGLAASIEGYFYTFASSLNGLFLPKVTRLYNQDGKKSHNKITELMIKVGRIQIMIIMLLFIGFVLLGNDFIKLWVGVGFDEVYMSAILLIIPSIFYLPQQIAQTSIIATDKIKDQSLVYMLMALINLGLAFYFSSFLGAVGAAISIMISYTIRNIGMNFIYKVKLDLNIKRFFIDVFIKLLPTVVIVSLFGYGISRMFEPNTWTYLLVKTVGITAIYTVCIWLLYMNKFEKVLLISTMKFVFSGGKVN